MLHVAVVPDVSVDIASEVNENIYERNGNEIVVEAGREFALTCTSSGLYPGKAVWEFKDGTTESMLCPESV